jgi:hypothetical protein
MTIHGTSELAVVVHEATLGLDVRFPAIKPVPPFPSSELNTKGAVKVQVSASANGPAATVIGLFGFITEKFAFPAVPISECGSVT